MLGSQVLQVVEEVVNDPPPFQSPSSPLQTKRIPQSTTPHIVTDTPYYESLKSMFLSDIYKTDTLYFEVLETDLRVAKNRYLSW